MPHARCGKVAKIKAKPASLGIFRDSAFCLKCRIRHFRHTLAVRTIMAWYRKGLDPDREMSKLSTYLGHSTPENTYWYIEAVPELLQLASERAERAMHRKTSNRTSTQ
jgi:hypothetical protein